MSDLHRTRIAATLSATCWRYGVLRRHDNSDTDTSCNRAPAADPAAPKAPDAHLGEDFVDPMRLERSM